MRLLCGMHLKTSAHLQYSCGEEFKPTTASAQAESQPRADEEQSSSLPPLPVWISALPLAVLWGTAWSQGSSKNPLARACKLRQLHRVLRACQLRTKPNPPAAFRTSRCSPVGRAGSKHGRYPARSGVLRALFIRVSKSFQGQKRETP